MGRGGRATLIAAGGDAARICLNCGGPPACAGDCFKIKTLAHVWRPIVSGWADRQGQILPKSFETICRPNAGATTHSIIPSGKAFVGRQERQVSCRVKGGFPLLAIVSAIITSCPHPLIRER